VSVLPAPSFPPVFGEDSASRVVRIVKFYAGCSLSKRRQDLAALVGRGVDDESVVTWATNCATFALGVLAAAGFDYAPLKTPLKNGMEFSLLAAVGHKFDAWRDLVKDGPPKSGAIMWYRTPERVGQSPKNDDHAEFLLGSLAGWIGLHGGGGRANNLISGETGDVRTSLSRPMYMWLDPNALGLPDASASDSGQPVAGGGNDPDATFRPT
jgi:hypothetical protein